MFGFWRSFVLLIFDLVVVFSFVVVVVINLVVVVIVAVVVEVVEDKSETLWGWSREPNRSLFGPPGAPFRGWLFSTEICFNNFFYKIA